MSGFFHRNPNFLLIWVGQVLSQSGGRMYQMAMVWWLLGIGLAAPGKYVGFFMVMVALPSILLVKKIGATIDRLYSKHISSGCDCMACLMVAAVGLLVCQHWMNLPLLFIIGFAAAVLQAFIDPTLNKAVQEVVEKDDIEGSVSLLSSTQSMANFSGAVAGAVLIDRVGIAGTAWIASGGYLISSICSLSAQFRFRLKSGKGDREGGSGWSILASYGNLKRILISFGIINFFATPTLVVLPIYTRRTLHATATTLGTLEAGLWLGLLLGSLCGCWVNFLKNRIHLASLGCFIFGLGLAFPGVVTSLPLYRVALFVAGGALGIVNVKFIAYFQQIVDPAIKGRFFALLQAMIGFTFPIAYFLFGALTDYITPPQVCLIQGVGVVTISASLLLISKGATSDFRPATF